MSEMPWACWKLMRRKSFSIEWSIKVVKTRSSTTWLSSQGCRESSWWRTSTSMIKRSRSRRYRHSPALKREGMAQATCTARTWQRIWHHRTRTRADNWSALRPSAFKNYTPAKTVRFKTWAFSGPSTNLRKLSRGRTRTTGRMLRIRIAKPPWDRAKRASVLPPWRREAFQHSMPIQRVKLCPSRRYQVEPTTQLLGCHYGDRVFH